MNLNFVYTREYDVVVCGLGSAGFTAAVMCGRLGMKTAAVEKYNMPGGVITVLGNNSIDQFNNPFIPGDNLVIKGIGWEFVNRLAKSGNAVIPDMNVEYHGHWQYGVKVNPCAASAMMNRMISESGADIYLGQNIVDTICSEHENGRSVDGVVISTKAGPALLRAKMFIDCTGDADICAFSGFRCLTGDDGIVQPGNIYGGGHTEELPCHSSDSDKLTFDEIHARELLSEKKRDWFMCAPAIAPRESRRVVCRSMMSRDDYMTGKMYSDAICYTFWFIDIHRDGETAYIEYLKSPLTPSIRLSSMIPEGSANLFVAGRCIGTDRAANSAIRVKSSCMAMGQAAAAAAYEALRKTSYDIDVESVKRILRESGAVVPEAQIK